jgi:tetratricopeptide (TPR) repeat protein
MFHTCAYADADAESGVYAKHETELRAREAILGPSHPQLADALSNMAILYSQNGSNAKALPLYERALRIYEASYGPDDPNVAHTLTDIAVLHLEQVIPRQNHIAETISSVATVLCMAHLVCTSTPNVISVIRAGLSSLHPRMASEGSVNSAFQGNDEMGRPLLERALVIQEAHLGLDHPDVVAIRDVLEGEDDTY